ncbi:MAG TPA: hypothetical protein VGH74_07730 [Planctomycetaceae bacterium]|jgi:hypothetical protein
MDILVTNNGPFALRVIVDGDNVNDLTLEPDEQAAFNSHDQGTVEFRELGDPGAPDVPVGRPKK